MSDLSLKQYLERSAISNNPIPKQGLRSYCAPSMKTISVRSLMSSLRVIHISDLHIFADEAKNKCDALEAFLLDRNNRQILATNIIIITGDLTAGALHPEQARIDFEKAKEFIRRLAEDYVVFVTPGNHDYWITGGLSLTPPSERDLRREMFSQYISGGMHEYPYIVELPNGRLILLDSMEGQLGIIFGQGAEIEFGRGMLGEAQLQKLDAYLSRLDIQAERRTGKKIVIALHHSPFMSVEEIQVGGEPLLENEPWSPADKLGLHDRESFLSKIVDKIDCLLYGHITGPLPWQDHRPWLGPEENLFANAEKYYRIPLINCENLENIAVSYSVTVLDLGSYQRIVYQTDPLTQSIQPSEYSWGVPPEWA